MTQKPKTSGIFKDTSLLPDENPDIRKEAISLLGEDVAQKWLNAKNIQLRLQTPNELIGTPDEPLVRNILRTIKTGNFDY